MGYADTLNLDPSFEGVTGGSSSVDLTLPQYGSDISTIMPVSEPSDATLAGLGISDLAPYAGSIGRALGGAGTSLGLGVASGASSAVAAFRRRARARGMGSGPGYDIEVPLHRRINVLNPKALRRAMRRVQGFEHFARKVVFITHGPGYKVHAFRKGHCKHRRHRRRF